MSGFVFRLFEDLNVTETDPGRFKLEIMVNRGATVDRDIVQNATNHTVPILHENFVDINKRLTVEQVETFFEHLLSMQETTMTPPMKESSKKPKKDKKDKKRDKKAKDPAEEEESKD